jgi:hypothetical protein
MLFKDTKFSMTRAWDKEKILIPPNIFPDFNTFFEILCTGSLNAKLPYMPRDKNKRYLEGFSRYLETFL